MPGKIYTDKQLHVHVVFPTSYHGTLHWHSNIALLHRYSTIALLHRYSTSQVQHNKHGFNGEGANN
jgi:hypothetical protein